MLAVIIISAITRAITLISHSSSPDRRNLFTFEPYGRTHDYPRSPAICKRFLKNGLCRSSAFISCTLRPLRLRALASPGRAVTRPPPHLLPSKRTHWAQFPLSRDNAPRFSQQTRPRPPPPPDSPCTRQIHRPSSFLL